VRGPERGDDSVTDVGRVGMFRGLDDLGLMTLGLIVNASLCRAFHKRGVLSALKHLSVLAIGVRRVGWVEGRGGSQHGYGWVFCA